MATGSTGRLELLPPCTDSSLLRDPGLKVLTTISARIVPPGPILCLHADKLTSKQKSSPVAWRELEDTLRGRSKRTWGHGSRLQGCCAQDWCLGLLGLNAEHTKSCKPTEFFEKIILKLVLGSSAFISLCFSSLPVNHA